MQIQYEENYETEEIYTCLYCGHEDRADKFGKYCPYCGTDLDELEKENEQ